MIHALLWSAGWAVLSVATLLPVRYMLRDTWGIRWLARGMYVPEVGELRIEYTDHYGMFDPFDH